MTDAASPEDQTDRRSSRDRDDTGSSGEQADQLRQRVILLTIVLVFSTIITPLIHRTSPARSFAVVSDSMEPTIPKGSLVIVEPGTPEVGEVGAYESPMGRVQIHRLHDVEIVDDTRYYTFKGDNNPTPDSFRVTEEDIVGVATGQVEGLGELWALSLQIQALIMGGLVGLYLVIAGWESRGILRTKGSRILSVVLGLLMVAPLAAGGVHILYPLSPLGADVLGNPAFDLAEGTAGHSSVEPTNASADATAPDPEVWKEVESWGGPGQMAVSDQLYTAHPETEVMVNVSQYDPEPTFYLEATIEGPSGSDAAYVRLQNVDTGSAVAGSEVTRSETSLDRVRSGPIDLSGEAAYQVEAKVDGGTAEVHQVKLLAVHELPRDTVTQVRLHSSAETTSDTHEAQDQRVLWRFDGAAMDGLTAAYFEAVVSGDDGAEVRLRDATDGGTDATIDVTTGSTKRYRTADILSNLTAGNEYEVTISTDGDLIDSIDLETARIVLQQDGLSETVSYTSMKLYNTTDSGTFSTVGYPARYHGSVFRGGESTYLEASLRNNASASGTTEARLVDAGGEVVDGSTVTASGTSLLRNRTPVSLPTANTTYRLEVRATESTTAHTSNAWVVRHVDQDRRKVHDRVLETHVDGTTCTWNTTLDLAFATDASRLGRTNVSLRFGGASPWEPGTLPSARQGASAAWDGDHAYAFGGRNATDARLDDVVRYDPGTGGSTTLDVTLPSARNATSAVWADGTAYVFGGATGPSSATDEIVAVDPSSGTASVVATLPGARLGTAAVWTGDAAYVLGGWNFTGGHTGEIVRFDPATGEVTTMGANLTPVKGASAAWSGDHAYVLGGEADDGGVARTDAIQRYDPAADSATTLTATLPTPRTGTSAFWDGSAVHALGGEDGGRLDEVVEYDPARDLVTVRDPSLPTAREGTTAVWNGTKALVLGGEDGAGAEAGVVHLNATVEALRADVSPVATGATFQVGSGATFHHVVTATPSSPGTSVLEAELVSTCQGANLQGLQRVTYTLD